MQLLNRTYVISKVGLKCVKLDWVGFIEYVIQVSSMLVLEVGNRGGVLEIEQLEQYLGNFENHR